MHIIVLVTEGIARPIFCVPCRQKWAADHPAAQFLCRRQQCGLLLQHRCDPGAYQRHRNPREQPQYSESEQLFAIC